MTNEGPRRLDGDATLGSAPSEYASSNDSLTPLRFDPAEFMQFVEDEGLSEEEAAALLRAIWDIVVAFVDLGFGLNPVQQALVDRSRMNAETHSPRVPDRVSSKEEFSKIANNKPAGRFYRGSAMPEES